MKWIWGIVMIAFGLIGWIGQFISAFFPDIAAKWGLTEHESEVDPTFWADTRGEAVWDSIILWTLPTAGILLILNNSVWTIFGLVGGGMYLYFAGRGILTRRALQCRNIPIGKPATRSTAYTFLTIWGLIALVTIILVVSSMHAK